jgi:predicted rRNA methylase YqxC with S4 and FtsJ domains
MDKNNNYENSLALSVYLVASAPNIRRNVAKLLIRKGLVMVNGEMVTNILHPVYLDDKVMIKDKLLTLSAETDNAFRKKTKINK